MLFPMRVLLSQVRIVDPRHLTVSAPSDILIVNGHIERIADRIDDETAQRISFPNAYVSPGWVDLFADFGDPGFERKEDLASGCAAAAAGGFTEVCLVPNTSPVVQSKAELDYLLHKSRHLPVTIRPLGAISKDLEGKALAELYDLHTYGAVAFSDGWQPVQSAGLLLKALEYVRAFDGLIIQLPDNQSLSAHGLMHEGIHSVRLGMPGIPAISELIQVQRDTELARYAASRIHFTGISTREALQVIARAKEEGLQVSCSVTPYHLALTDACLESYDTNLKVMPPLRSQEDLDALKQAVQQGLIDAFATHHRPQDIESKQVEFEYAAPGMIGLESFFGIMNRELAAVELTKKIAMLTTKPRSLLRLPEVEISVGKEANLTIFDPDKEWIFEEKHIRSKSHHTPFIGQRLKGFVYGILTKNQLVLHNSSPQ
ncbi:dihydroorotase [Thermoflavifilum aggregans]|uniref:Dihydroorotase n=2 Tax=Thermoflavifilum aggregans TaxID=454188 RepID=A0A2M9CU73_9BACT|nr:dihydroorotase [Thermoflavifilum aggregans]